MIICGNTISIIQLYDFQKVKGLNIYLYMYTILKKQETDKKAVIYRINK